MAEKLKTGDTVLLEVKHLHGIAATVLHVDDEEGNVTLRIQEETFEGHIVQFPESVCVPLSHKKVQEKHEKNQKKFNPALGQVKPESPLEVGAGDRLEWAYQE
ncbi:MAG TPA: hypothetical protein VKW06_10375 [Candidatus Angelobacter sp.]|nr:hypothetical protein [Candidatus Angelobacter sp.]